MRLGAGPPVRELSMVALLRACRASRIGSASLSVAAMLACVRLHILGEGNSMITGVGAFAQAV